MNKKYLLYVFLLVVLLQSCIEGYDINIPSNTKRLVVEGLLTDNAFETDTIKIYYSENQGGSFSEKKYPENIKAFIVVQETKEVISLVSPSLGSFVLPEGKSLPVNRSYQLRFTLPNGNEYESTFSKKRASPAILRVYDKFNLKSRQSPDGKKFFSANDVFIDFEDAPQEKNYYLWRYVHYERLYYCKSCYSGLADFLKVGEAGICDEEPFASRGVYLNGTTYVYGCKSTCFRTFRSDYLNTNSIFSDKLSNGTTIKGLKVANIPYYIRSNGCLIEIQQMNISPELYQYYTILKNISTQTGTLVDVPPAAIVGNIKNINNPNDKVIGFFEVANAKSVRYWIDRNEASGEEDYILGRRVVLERSGEFRDNIPTPVVLVDFLVKN